MTEARASGKGRILEWLAEALAQHLGEALELMTGESAQVAWTTSEAGPPPEQTSWWRQSFSLASGAEIWIGAPEASWSEIGSHVLQAAGIEPASEADRKNTYQEILGQAFASLARTLSERVGREITAEEGGEAEPPEPPETSAVVDLTLSDGAPLSLWAVFSRPLLAALEQPVAGEKNTSLVAPEQEAGAPAPQERTAATASRSSGGGGRTLDLLLEVEMPVSVSFGRAQLPLRDVLKLTTGSIIELNRTVNEPVEVIVNNCVIARGEVVVIEGNYGIRIQQIISRQERLRTLK